MRRVLKKGIAVALAAAMVVTLAPASADAAKKPSVKKKASVQVGKTTKIKVKNGSKKAKVTWKTSNKKVAKITKKTTKGNKATATVKGVKKGKAKITASYKLGKKKAQKLVCTVTVGNATVPVATPTPGTNTTPTPVPTNQGGGSTVTPPPSDPTPTPTPVSTPTPSPRPKNKNLDAWQAAEGSTFTIDGKVEAGEGWEDSTPNDLLTDITKTSGVRKPNASDVDAAKEIPVTEAKANIMWSGKDVYVLMNVKGDSDKVIIYYDENSKGTKDTATKIEIPVGDGAATSSNAAYAVEAKTAKADGSYVVEAKITGKADLAVDGKVNIDIQMNKGDVSVNFYDTRSAMVYNEETKEFELGDAEVKVGDNAELMGPVTLLGQMPAATSAFFTEFGAQILEASGIESAEFETTTPAEGEEAKTTNTKAVKYVDAKYWTDTYADHGAPSIEFSKVNTGDKVYINNPEKITLGTPVLDGDGNAVLDEDGVPTFTTSRDQAQAYIIWDDDYLYVMFDVNDPDISPANNDHYTTDSTELFLDEDASCNAYDAEKDAVQLRVDVANNVFSSNDAGAGNYAVVGHAVGYKHADGTVDDKIEGATGYQTQYIIKLNSKHAPNTVMGMELQINDCYTSDVDNSGNAFTDADGNPVNGALRAGTITAYDTTNTAYENPERFERLKLIKKGVTEGPSDPTDKPADPTDKPADPTDNRLDLSKINIADGSTIEVNDDGSAVITCAGNYTGGITIDIPAELADGAKKMVVAVDAEPSSGQFNLEFDGDETVTQYNWGADTYNDTTFDVTGKKPTKLVLNSQDNNVFTIKYIEVQK